MQRTLIALVCILPLFGAVVDRVAVSFGTKVITTSEIEERIRLTAFQNNTKPDFSPASWKEAAERLIDQKLVEREMLVGRYEATEEDEAGALLAQYTKEHYPNESALRKVLQESQLTVQQLQRDLARQADLLTFLSLRFRPAVQVSEEDIRKYYRDNIEPKNTPDHNVSLDEARSAIEDLLTNQRADQELYAWLKDQRKRVKVDYHMEAFPGERDGAAK